MTIDPNQHTIVRIAPTFRTAKSNSGSDMGPALLVRKRDDLLRGNGERCTALVMGVANKRRKQTFPGNMKHPGVREDLLLSGCYA